MLVKVVYVRKLSNKNIKDKTKDVTKDISSMIVWDRVTSK